MGQKNSFQSPRTQHGRRVIEAHYPFFSLSLVRSSFFISAVLHFSVRYSCVQLFVCVFFVSSVINPSCIRSFHLIDLGFGTLLNVNECHFVRVLF